MGYLDNYKTKEEIKQMAIKRDRKLRSEFNRNKKKRKKIKEQNKTTCPKNYSVYIKSKWWTKRKKEYYQSHPKICVVCQATKYIQLHHMTYKDYGKEKDEHLVSLCRGCHEEFHTIYKWHWNLIEPTNKFIIEKRESLDFPKL